MERMPYVEQLNETPVTVTARVDTFAREGVTATDWREKLPALGGGGIVLRELQIDDAPSLFANLTTEEVSRFISPPPSTVEAFEKFIQWTRRQRAAGEYVCFAVIPEGMTEAVGLFQVRSLERGFTAAEWGFAIGSAYWGTGLFAEGAQLVLDFAFNTIGAHRIEARSSVANGRGNGALRKVGAVHEGVLRNAFLRDGVYHDQNLWSILATEWSQAVPVDRAATSSVLQLVA
jgi:RimJ/RimL family protein N-acetyltransferase